MKRRLFRPGPGSASGFGAYRPPVQIHVNGVDLWFDVDGPKLVPDGPTMRERPTLLLLHGAPGGTDHSSFKPLFEQLTDVAQVVYLDLRGCGRSGPAEEWTLEAAGDDIAAFCDTLGIEHPTVLGTSGGGFVALAYAIRHPSHPDGVILSSTQARFVHEHVIAECERLGGAEAKDAAQALVSRDPDVLAQWRRVVLPLYNKRPAPDPDAPARITYRMETWAKFNKLWYLGGNTFDLHANLHRIECPTLIMTGVDDPICPTRDSDDILDGLRPGIGRLVRFNDCGHGAWRDHPDEALGVIRDFLLDATPAR
jgi:pimeloyl-ACP methyl ester carboxylesterase